MNLLGIEFGRVWNASGSRNFFGEGWRHHRPLRPLGLDFAGATFVAKTTTLAPRAGNLPLRGTTPTEVLPRCIRVNWRRGAVLNAVGLSGPGLEALLADGRWQSRADPFFLSFMAVSRDPEEWVAECEGFAIRVARERPRFLAPFGVQLNVSCPNLGADPYALASWDGFILKVSCLLSNIRFDLPGVPLVPKFNALVPVAVAREIAEHPACDAVCVSNTIPWGKLPDRIDWRGLFGEVSPLADLGGGGLSGAPLLPIVQDWLIEAMVSDFPKPVIAGGGILGPDDAGVLFSHGASAVEIGCVSIVRPWRVRGVIKSINGSMP